MRKKVIMFLTPYWKEHLNKVGMTTVKKQVEAFNLETKNLQNINWVKAISFLIHPHHLSYYISFKRTRRTTLKSFWRFSTALYKLKQVHTKGIITSEEWQEYLSQYFEGTFNSKNERSRLLIMSEVLKLID